VSFTFPTDHPEDFAGVEFGCGWVGEDPRLGYVAVDHSQEVYIQLPATSQRTLALEDSRARREAVERAAHWQDVAEERAFRWVQQGGQVRTSAELIADVSVQMDRADRREESRVRSAVLAGELELQPVPTPGLRSERFQMEREQRERAEAQAVRQVQGSELDELRQEVTHLKSLLAARGVR
jgi:hypothetical protein